MIDSQWGGWLAVLQYREQRVMEQWHYIAELQWEFWAEAR